MAERSLADTLGLGAEQPTEGATGERALQPRTPRMPTLVGGMRGGMIGGVDIDPARLGLKPPRLQIIHKRDRRDQQSEPGQMVLGKLVFDEVTAVFIRAHAGRQLPLGEGKESHIACASEDGKEPLSDIQAFSEHCKPCAYAQWETVNGKRVPPPCTTLTAMLGVLLEGKTYASRNEPEKITPGEFRPFWLIGSKTGEIPLVDLLTEAQRLSMEEGVDHLSQLVVQVTTKENAGDAFTWYTPEFAILRRLDRKDYQEMAEQAAELRWAPTVRQEASDREKLPTRAVEGDEHVDDSDIPF